MAKASPLQSDFAGGEFNPLFQGRVDSERYKTGLATCKNMCPILQGPLTRRPGTYLAGAAKSSTLAVLLVPFQFSISQSYILEFGNGYIRFWTNAYTQVMSGGVPYEIASPYTTGDLSQIRWTQNADVLYLAHPKYAPRTLTRFANTTWVIANPFTLPVGSSLIANRQPYLDTVALAYGPSNGAVNSLSMSALVLTAGGPGMFASTDVGRTIALNITGDGWCLYEIVGFTNNTVVTLQQCFDAVFTVVVTGAPSTSIVAYKLGVWSDTTGYPSCVTFHEDRLVFAGTTNYPQRVDGSRVSDYLNFTPFAPDGTVTASCAYSFSMNSQDLNLFEWLVSDEQALIAGSTAGEWAIRASVYGEAITPTNISAKKTTYWGSASVSPVKAGKSTVHVQRGGKKIREMMYRFEYAGFISTEITELSAHIPGGSINPAITPGVSALTYQQNPYSIIWGLRNDGQLIGCTFDHDAQALRAGWHRHTLGGKSNAQGDPPFIQSIAVIPSADGTRDDLWMAVLRYINGVQTVSIEYTGKFFEQTDEQKDAHLLDCGYSYDVPITVTSITAANPAVVTASAHGLSNGDSVILERVEGMTQVNGLSFTVAGATTNTFQLSGYDATLFTVGSGGQVRKKVTTITGLDYLDGETIQVMGDGALQPDCTVSAGSVTLSVPAATVHLGYAYQSDMKMLPIEAGSANGTALGKTRRTQRVGMYLFQTLGMKFGYDFSSLDTYDFQTSSTIAGGAQPLFTGIISETVDSDYDFYNQLCLRFDTALPATVLAIAPLQETQDR